MRTAAWTTADAERLYNMPAWSAGYFGVDAEGRVALRHAGGELALDAVIDRGLADGLRLPLLLRFDGILRDRVRQLVAAFDSALAEIPGAAGYTAVYPIKVNQQASVVREILAAGAGRVGLEAGSKPELMAVLALAPSGGRIICNGYKDRAYVRLALIGQQLGHEVTLVIEKLSEIDLVASEAAALGITPRLGLRVRLASVSAGNWQNTGGEKSKFGLSSPQCLEALRRLDGHGGRDWLRLVHFHLGSQIANLRDIRRGVREAARFYAELRAQGLPLDTVDVGGGLGVDYEGTRSRSACSVNYGLAEYATTVAQSVAAVCQETGQPMPALISESGRALTAHHAVLVTDVIDTERPPAEPPPLPAEDAHPLLRELAALLSPDSELPALEALHEGRELLEQALRSFSLGELDLDQRASAESLMLALEQRVIGALNPQLRAHREELDGLREKLADRFFCNFSVFQSLPDVWAIGQIFPITPLSRLNRRPTRRALIRDLTCDSDGRIDHYVDEGGIESSLPVHDTEPGDGYRLGFFLVGAYQEILGDMHNLFGDTDAANVALEGDSWRLTDIEKGDRADELLAYVHLAPATLLDAINRKLDAADLEPARRDLCRDELAAGLAAYTYLGG